ncbi:hypothetical protein, partial [Mesorhizobium sp. P5_C1]
AQGLAQPVGQFEIVFDKQQPHFYRCLTIRRLQSFTASSLISRGIRQCRLNERQYRFQRKVNAVLRLMTTVFSDRIGLFRRRNRTERIGLRASATVDRTARFNLC